MSFTIAPAAQLELIEAAAWYDDIRLGLGTEFLDAIQHAFARVAAEPRLYASLEYSTASRREVRRYCLRRFPYVIVYWIEGDSVTVVAVSHARRQPLLDRPPPAVKAYAAARGPTASRTCMPALNFHLVHPRG